MTTPAPQGAPPQTPPPGTPPPADPPAGTVPYKRFQTVVGERNNLREQVATLRAEAQQLTERGATVDTLTAANTALQGKLDAANSRYDRHTLIAQHGVTDKDAVAAVEWQYGRLPEEGRPELGAWLDSFKEAPESVPTILRPLFAGAPPQGGGAPPYQRPPANRGAHLHRPAPGPSDTSAMTDADFSAAFNLKTRG